MQLYNFILGYIVYVYYYKNKWILPKYSPNTYTLKIGFLVVYFEFGGTSSTFLQTWTPAPKIRWCRLSLEMRRWCQLRSPLVCSDLRLELALAPQDRRPHLQRPVRLRPAAVPALKINLLQCILSLNKFALPHSIQ
jgi:hypothetical protein